MKDHSELKRLAEAATPGPWAYDGSYVCPARTEDGTTYVELWRSIADCHQPENTKFIAAANPAAVLALVAEVEGLRKLPTAWSEVYEQSDELDALRDEKLAWLSERDQLKADNDLQAKEIEALRKAVEFGADCFRKISSGDGSGHADLAESILRIAGSTISKVHNK